jgi:hypothetical protein
MTDTPTWCNYCAAYIRPEACLRKACEHKDKKP